MSPDIKSPLPPETVAMHKEIDRLISEGRSPRKARRAAEAEQRKRRRREARKARLLTVGLLLICFGCGGPPGVVEDATAYAGVAIQETDVELAREITEESDRLIAELRVRVEAGELASGPAMASFEHGMEALFAARRAVSVAADTWTTLDSALRAWEAGVDGAENAWMAAAACLVAAVESAVQALEHADVEVPERFDGIRRTVRPITNAICEGATAGGER